MIKKYEGVFILKNNENIEVLERVMNKIYNFLKNKCCAKILQKEALGLKKTAYPIKGENQGHYYVVKFEISDDKNDGINNLNKYVNTIEDVLKYLVISVED